MIGPFLRALSLEAGSDIVRFLRALSPSRYKPLCDAAESGAMRFLDFFDLVLTTRFQIENKM
jgi:hypothetical protein